MDKVLYFPFRGLTINLHFSRTTNKSASDSGPRNTVWVALAFIKKILRKVFNEFKYVLDFLNFYRKLHLKFERNKKKKKTN